MSTDAGARAEYQPLTTMRLAGVDFAFVTSLNPERDASGTIVESSPQGRYAQANTVPLHKHGEGTFCTFRIGVAKGRVGVYALVVDESVQYIGECADLRERFNSRGYGKISPRNCFAKGQPTNCKINRRVLDVSKAGGRVDLYFHPSLSRKAVEKQLVERYSPPWND